MIHISTPFASSAGSSVVENRSREVLEVVLDGRVSTQPVLGFAFSEARGLDAARTERILIAAGAL
jgi:hypothetical protein